MASESTEHSRRKHRRSSPSDEEVKDTSKRRKHRHHHRRHRHHSKKHHEGDSNPDIETDKAEAEIEHKKQELGGVATGLVNGCSNFGIDYDMEEGEIIDDILPSGAGVDDLDGRNTELGLDRETEDIVVQNHRLLDLNKSDMKHNKAQLDGPNSSAPSEDNLEKVEMNSISSGVDNAKRKDRECDYKIHKHVGQETTYSEGHHANGNSDGEHRGAGHTRYVGKHSPNKESRKQRSYYANENDFNQRGSVTLESSGKWHTDKDGFDIERMSGHNRDHQYGRYLRERGERSPSHSRYDSREVRHRSRETIERYREASLDIDRDRAREKDHERARENYRVRERESDRERAHAREKERDRHRDKDSDGERGRERRRDKDKDSRGGRSREREWERDSVRSSRQSRYDDFGRSHGDRDRYGASRHIRDDETAHCYRNQSGNAEGNKSDKSIIGMGSDKFRRDEDEQEEYQEKITMQLAEQEEDTERIKEESRRRRQAILEKYKNRQPPIQTKNCSEERDKAVQGNNRVPESDARTDDTDTSAGDADFSVGKSPRQEHHSVNELTSGVGGLGHGTPKSERLHDMFCDDIFGESPAGDRKQDKADSLTIERAGLHDNWDDAEGYYSYRFGEVLDGRYEIIAAHGKGVFSMVVRAKDLKAKPGDPEEVAIKMIRNNDTMYKAGMEELVILKKLVGSDPEDRRHCVRFLSSFKYRNHLCLVFESLHMNLREVLKKFGRNIGLKLTAVRAYAKQLFIALKHLRNCGVLHCDIKPDNMLVNEAKNVLKLCDFGNAMFAGKNEITPYLVSRFYRSPEIILGLTYDHPMDMWSVGCCLYELYTGKVLFPGQTNNDMLRLQMELKGPFPKKMLRKGAFMDKHFDQDLNFLATEEDPVTKKAVRKMIVNVKPKDIGTIVLGSPGEDPKMFTHFKDLLERIFMLDPDKRLTVSQALSHPFITGK
ncbi:unnamed protein product [Cuscuta epithymum]|uniref:Serine/threonine-protein kinase PRP4 homolog n=1 Tax=Cuscuta epithymum TaxID=186058 RepID=A0AAV0GJR1_9ASTE|nr:unnamed protein product [Cuscuta epithymum]